ncbi:MAG TPA: hypothetical protein VF746_02295 [Longimicrobium sp.]|jgi:hypothetical protein
MGRYILYEVVESQRFRAQMGEHSDIQRWDEVMEAVIFALARDPHGIGQPTSHPEIFALPTEAAPGVPAFVIYYRILPKQVELVGLKLVDDALEF